MIYIDRLGVEFGYYGDRVIWTWPWRRYGRQGAFISILASGTGEWGDARFRKLRDVRTYWDRAAEEASR